MTKGKYKYQHYGTTALWYDFNCSKDVSARNDGVQGILQPFSFGSRLLSATLKLQSLSRHQNQNLLSAVINRPRTFPTSDFFY